MHSRGMRTAGLLTVSQHALPRGVSVQGVSAQEGGVCQGEGVYLSMQWGSSPSVDRQTPVKAYLRKFRLRAVKIRLAREI